MKIIHMVTFNFINFGCLNAKYLSHVFLPRKRVQHFPQIFFLKHYLVLGY